MQKHRITNFNRTSVTTMATAAAAAMATATRRRWPLSLIYVYPAAVAAAGAGLSCALLCVLFALGFAINNYSQPGSCGFFACPARVNVGLWLAFPLSISLSLFSTGFCILKAISSPFFGHVVFAFLPFFCAGDFQ